MSRVEIPEIDTDLRIFHNRLRILMCIDKHELVEAGLIASNNTHAWASFSADPYRWFIRCGDEQASKLFGIIQKREQRT